MLTKFKRGATWYVRGTVAVGERSKSVYESTRLRDEAQAETYRALLEASCIDELLHGSKHKVTFEKALVSYGESGGSDRFMEPLLDRFGAMVLRDIGQSDLDLAARELYPACQADTLNRQCYTPFISVYNHAVTNGWADLRKWKRPRKAKGTRAIRVKGKRAGSSPTTYDKAARFVEAMSPAAGMLMTFMFYTGMRPIEAFMLDADCVNVEGRWISLKHTKTGEPRGVPIHEFIAPILASLLKRNSLAEDGRLFRTQRGIPYRDKDDGGGQMKTAILGARKRTEVDGVSPYCGISPYTARHTVSTQLVVNGVHPYIKDQILGHAVTDMSRLYTDVPQQPLIDAINTLPVPDAWRFLPWLEDPLGHSLKLVKGTGRRTDLEEKKKAAGG